MFVIGIDIGIYHMGVVGVKINQNYTINEIEFCKLVDIKNYSCNRDCKLFHDECIADYMSHFFKENQTVLDRADHIIIERQPPMGLIAIQELLVFKYRSKSKLVSPSSMHCHFSISDLNYEQRKIRVVKMIEHQLNKFKSFTKLERKHDVADALCILKFWLFKENQKYEEAKRLEEWKANNSTFIKNLNDYRYIPKLN